MAPSGAWTLACSCCPMSALTPTSVQTSTRSLSYEASQNVESSLAQTLHKNSKNSSSKKLIPTPNARWNQAVTQLQKAIFLECWYQHVLRTIYSWSGRTKPSRRTFLKREGILRRGM